MYAKRPATTLFLFVVSLGITSMGCHHTSSGMFRTIDDFRESTGKIFPKTPAVTTTITISAGCEASADPAETHPGEYVAFCNESECPVSIVFEETSLFGREDLTLATGECVSLRVMSDTDRDDGYLYHLTCECDMTGHSTPQIIVSPPPPPSP